MKHLTGREITIYRGVDTNYREPTKGIIVGIEKGKGLTVVEAKDPDKIFLCYDKSTENLDKILENFVKQVEETNTYKPFDAFCKVEGMTNKQKESLELDLVESTLLSLITGKTIGSSQEKLHDMCEFSRKN